MKLPLKVEYACRALAQLAKTHASGKLLHIDQLAEAEAIPKNYLVQILTELRGGGLITSRRGKQGGYALVREPEAITLHDVIKVMDSDLLDAKLSKSGQSGTEVAGIWETVSEIFTEATKKHTLKSFMKDDGDMWHI